MPKSTYYNLSQERKNEIIQVCFEEFALNDYDHASISRIVRKLGIAKGSFYRYFESKKELYLFLMDHVTAMRREHVKELFELYAMDLFTLLEQHLVQKIRFDLSFPLQSAFLTNAIQWRSNEELGNASTRSKEMQIELLEPVIEKYQKRGVVRTDIYKDLIAYLVVEIQMGIVEFMLIRYKKACQKNSNKPNEVFSIPDREILSTVKEFSKILAEGLTIQ